HRQRALARLSHAPAALFYPGYRGRGSQRRGLHQQLPLPHLADRGRRTDAAAHYPLGRVVAVTAGGFRWLLLALCAGGVAASDWPVYGGDAGGQHYSTLDQINRDNVA